jgi:metallo-beta-lactamase class B
MKKILFGILLLVAACSTKNKSALTAVPDDTVYKTDTLVIKKLSDKIYQHISFLNTESFGRVECNGMIVINGNEAIVFDTPTDDPGTTALLDYLATQNKTVTAVVATHFHNDCVGGLQEFHTRGIPSYANNLTIQLIKEKAEGIVPQNGFDQELELQVGQQPVITTFIGSGHTRDNVVAYFPDQQTLFGGCLVKEVGASKGYLGDADTLMWSVTIAKLKAKYPQLKVVIPGHGKPGGVELLDYTEQLFSIKN